MLLVLAINDELCWTMEFYYNISVLKVLITLLTSVSLTRLYTENKGLIESLQGPRAAYLQDNTRWTPRINRGLNSFVGTSAKIGLQVIPKRYPGEREI